MQRLAHLTTNRHNERFNPDAGHGWPVNEANSAALHDAAAHSRMAEQAPHVRAQGSASSARPPFGEHCGQFRQHDVAETGMPGATVLATFAKTKVARSRE
ncbi:MAG: hypothetical protein ACREPH_13885 [Rhodanobacteraceae bacterium]